MSNYDPSDSSERSGQPGTTRTWWHPLLARLLDHVLATAYRVLEEVLVGKLPLRLDILLSSTGCRIALSRTSRPAPAAALVRLGT